MKRIEITVRGTVQGVFFRDHTSQQAKSLGLTGLVKNNPDGSVTIVAEGSEAKLRALSEWAKDGPEAATVDSHDVSRKPATREYPDFSVKL